MPALIKALAFGFLNDERFELAVLYGRIMFPYILLISLVQLFNSVLNALNLYHISTATPVSYTHLTLPTICSV